jgi:glycosyltransferase involved in cell wall biosynthesis
MPKLSVIIPTHNRADVISTAIASVLGQTYQDFEIVVVDDASTDGTAAVVKGLKDPRIRYIRNEINKGDAGSRNIGILNSDSEYIGFLDDDDEWLPEKLELQIKPLEKNPPEVGGVYTNTLIIDRCSGKVSNSITPEPRGKLAEEILRTNPVTTSSVLLRRRCFSKVGLFDESMPCSSDYDMWIRISKEFHFEFISKPLVRYYEHDIKLSTNYTKATIGMERLLEKNGTFFLDDKRSYSRRYAYLGLLHCLSGDTASGRKAYLKAIKLYPFRAKVYLHFCVSLLGSDAFQRLLLIKKKLRAWLRSMVEI